MTSEIVSTTRTIKASPESVFAIIANPITHRAIDGTGWVRDPLDRQALTESGQVFRMAMYDPGHPNGTYERANLVQAFDPPHAISWKPRYDPGDDVLRFGGWIWRYDLSFRSAHPKPKSGSPTIGQVYSRTCAERDRYFHPSPPITSTTHCITWPGSSRLPVNKL